MAFSIGIQLVMLTLAPQIRGFFLAIIFIIFAFGTLRLKLREALLVWLITCVAIAVMIQFSGNAIVIPPGAENALHSFAIWFSFALILLRTLLLGYYASQLRYRMLHLNSKLTEHVESSKEMAIRDELTGALNRRALMPLINEYLQLKQRKAIPCTIALLDVDHFKKVNDDFGHLVGDSALTYLVAFINRCTRISDKVGRFGGEEFLILMPATPLGEGVELAERVRAELAKTALDHIAQGLQLSVSIGVTDIGSRDTFGQIIQRADSCLYRAKSEGRNRVVWREAVDDGTASDRSYTITQQ
jgi:diguanylate cyclase (GGDEF)-like protein